MAAYLYKIERKRELLSLQKQYRCKCFTLVELLIVISIIGLLAAAVFTFAHKAREDASLTRAKGDLRNLAIALELYANDHGGYPPDVSRGVPAGLEEYMSHGIMPKAAWPGAVFDWENWINPNTGKPIYQISVRFCPAGASNISLCHFPDEPWAKNFKVDSSVYYCISGECSAHLNHFNDNPPYPSLCVNCNN